MPSLNQGPAPLARAQAQQAASRCLMLRLTSLHTLEWGETKLGLASITIEIHPVRNSARFRCSMSWDCTTATSR